MTVYNFSGHVAKEFKVPFIFTITQSSVTPLIPTMEAVKLNNARSDIIAVCVHAELRAHFLHQLVSKKALIDPSSRLVLVDPEMHEQTNFVECSLDGLAEIVRSPLDHVKDKEKPTYAFIYSRNCDESVVRDFLDNGVAAVLSVKGLLVKVNEDERLWFIEFNKAEDTILVKEQLKPGNDPESMHVCSRHRELFVSNKRHFLVGRHNRKENASDTKSGALNQIAQTLQTQSQLDAAMLTFLKKLIVGQSNKTLSSDDGESHDASSGDEDEQKTQRATKRRRTSDGAITQDAFDQLTNEQVKTLLIGRMRHRVEKKELVLPAWIKASFMAMRANPSLLQETNGASLAKIFNVSSDETSEAGYLFRDDGEWNGTNWLDRFEEAVQRGQPNKDGMPRPLLAVLTELMRALGIL